MARILGIDYGTKRSGVAVTDPAQLIVNGLAAVPTSQLEHFIGNYLAKEEVTKIVLGFPLHKDGEPTHLAGGIQSLKKRLLEKYPQIEVVLHDESYSTISAREVLVRSGLPKMKRRSKDTVNRVSAVIILQDYLQHI